MFLFLSHPFPIYPMSREGKKPAVKISHTVKYTVRIERSYKENKSPNTDIVIWHVIRGEWQWQGSRLFGSLRLSMVSELTLLCRRRLVKKNHLVYQKRESVELRILLLLHCFSARKAVSMSMSTSLSPSFSSFLAPTKLLPWSDLIWRTSPRMTMKQRRPLMKTCHPTFQHIYFYI